MSETWGIEIPDDFAADGIEGPADMMPRCHVLEFRFSESSKTSDASLDDLSEVEQIRAAKFHHRIDRNRFVVGRMMMRRVLGRLLDMPPRQVPIQVEKGRPFVDPSTIAPVFFNLTHSGDRVMLAVSRTQALGIDVEVERSFSDRDRVAGRVMTGEEYTRYLAMEPGCRSAAFFRLWVRKEAIMKYLGKGFAIEPARITVGHNTASSSGGEFEGQVFQLNQYSDQACGKTHFWALAHSGKHPRISLLRYPVDARYR